MSAIHITIDTSAATSLLASARGAVADRQAIHRAAAAAVGKQVRAWLIARNSARSKHATSNYWSHAAEATSAESDARSGRVLIRHPGVYWHRYGGTIAAKPGKAMAIPLRDSVYGVCPSERFPNRGNAFIWRRKGKAFLAARDGNALRLFYLLVKSVSKAADPTVLPPDSAMAATARAAMYQLVRLALARRRTA